MKRNFALIVGAMKCGTTSLFYYLSEHPEIAEAKNKEPHFFSYDCNLSTGMVGYQSLWNWNPEHTIALEASTTYTMQPKYPNVAEKIVKMAKEENANFRFIYIMRHPFYRIESHIRHLLSEKIIDAPKIIEEHINFSEYVMQIKAYEDLFGKDKIHLMLLEDLQQNPHSELRRICEFLGINPDYEFQRVNVVRNSQGTLNLHPTLRAIYKVPLVKSIGSLISPDLRQKLYKPLARKDAYQVKLSEQEKSYIVARLHSNLVALQTDYGIDVVSKWNLPIVV